MKKTNTEKEKREVRKKKETKKENICVVLVAIYF